MPVLNFAPSVSFFSALSVPPLRSLRTFVRTTEERFRPPQIALHRSSAARSGMSAGLDATKTSGPRATILRERGTGRVPTIVLGGLVPDASEQVFLLRRFLLRCGDVYYVQYPRDAFSLAELTRQLGELVAELSAAGQPPVIFAVSFGAGIVLHWLKTIRGNGIEPLLSGVVLVSPVSCVEDLIPAGTVKPTTLLGRALKPFLDGAAVDATVEKSRALFVRMFEAGAQNKQALRLLMTRQETIRLRDAVMATIRGVTTEGARQRTQALAEMSSPTSYFLPGLLPLTEAPTLVLFAQCEDAVLQAHAPVRLALERAPAAYFSQGTVRQVCARAGQAPVQHASLVFHVFEFLPPLQAFYQRVRRGNLAFAA